MKKSPRREDPLNKLAFIHLKIPITDDEIDFVLNVIRSESPKKTKLWTSIDPSDAGPVFVEFKSIQLASEFMSIAKKMNYCPVPREFFAKERVYLEWKIVQHAPEELAKQREEFVQWHRNDAETKVDLERKMKQKLSAPVVNGIPVKVPSSTGTASPSASPRPPQLQQDAFPPLPQAPPTLTTTQVPVSTPSNLTSTSPPIPATLNSNNPNQFPVNNANNNIGNHSSNHLTLNGNHIPNNNMNGTISPTPSNMQTVNSGQTSSIVNQLKPDQQIPHATVVPSPIGTPKPTQQPSPPPSTSLSINQSQQQQQQQLQLQSMPVMDSRSQKHRPFLLLSRSSEEIDDFNPQLPQHLLKELEDNRSQEEVEVEVVNQELFMIERRKFELEEKKKKLIDKRIYAQAAENSAALKENQLLRFELDKAKRELSQLRNDNYSTMKLEDLQELLNRHENAVTAIRNAVNQRMKEDRLCCVCFERERDTLTLPCGHVRMCQQCVKESNATICPQCRQRIESVVKVFI